LKVCDISRSTFYNFIKPKEKSNNKSSGRPIPGFSVNTDQTIILDPTIVSILKTYREDINYQNAGDCKVLMHLLRRDYGFNINHKKIYRLCNENGLLLPKNKKKLKLNRKVSTNRKITKPNQLWQFDIKQDYIHGENKYFYFLAIKDVFNKKIVGTHIGYHCKARDLKVTIDEAIRTHSIDINQLVIRSDNGPQITSHELNNYVNEIGLEHEFIPPRTPNKNAFIESFFSIFET
jgi:putative transposase